MHCWAGVHVVKGVWEPTCRALLDRSAGCLSVVGTYLRGPVMQGYRLFKWCRNIPTGHCIAGVQAV